MKMLKRRFVADTRFSFRGSSELADLAGFVSQNAKLEPKTRRYTNTKLITFAVGITQNPKYVALVLLDEPLSSRLPKRKAVEALTRITKIALNRANRESVNLAEQKFVEK